MQAKTEKIELEGAATQTEQIENLAVKAEETGAITAGIAQEVDMVMENKNVKTKVLEIADKLDRHAAMARVREFWKKTPQSIKWLILHFPPGMAGDVMTPILKRLILCGFLPYYEDPDENEKYLAGKDDYDQKFLKWSFAVGSVIQPEILVLEAIMVPVGKIMDMEGDYRKMIRRHLAQEKRINQIEATF